MDGGSGGMWGDGWEMTSSRRASCLMATLDESVARAAAAADACTAASTAERAYLMEVVWFGLVWLGLVWFIVAWFGLV